MAVAGTLRDGRFVLLQPIGEGAQGTTFDGVDKRPPQGLEGAVAIKRFDVRGARSWKDVELAEREARVLQSLSHPKLPTYIDHFEEDGALYLVMQKIEGENLAAYRKRGAVFGDDEVVRLLRDASEVLDYLHGRVPPVIHRDLKPGNVIRRPDGSFAFVDFGAVRDKLRHQGGSTVVGTFGYMAPEQLQGRALPGSDVYAIGATALAMLTGCEPEALPHRGLAIDVRQALGGRSQRPRPAHGRSEIRANARLVEVLESMLEPDPDQRASRIAPLLASMQAPRPHEAREHVDRAERYARRVERRARHAAARAERAARRVARWRTPRHRPSFWPARMIFALLITFGIVAVTLATRVLVPVVLGLLSLFFARRALSTAAEGVRNAGQIAVEGMRRSRRWLLEDVQPLEESSRPRLRVGEDAIPLARVAPDDQDIEGHSVAADDRALLPSVEEKPRASRR